MSAQRLPNLPSFPRGQVLAGRQQQIQEKIEQNRRAQEESLRHREQLIQNLEEARESARREKEESEELKSARKQELEAQVGPSRRSPSARGWELRPQGLRGPQDSGPWLVSPPGTTPLRSPSHSSPAGAVPAPLQAPPCGADCPRLLLSASADTSPWATALRSFSD